MLHKSKYTDHYSLLRIIDLIFYYLCRSRGKNEHRGTEILSFFYFFNGIHYMRKVLPQ